MTPSREYLADMAADLAQFLQAHGVAFETFAAHLRLDILGPREAWALKKFHAISGGVGTRSLLDLKTALAVNGITIPPQTATATVSGTGVDFAETDGPIHGILVVGAASGTGPTLSVRYQDCATQSGTYADISGATHAVVTAANQCNRARIMRTQRWVRAVGTMAGTTPSFSFAVAVEGMKKDS